MPHRQRGAAVKQMACAGKQQLEVVIELGHRADRGTRRAHRVGLVDGNGRWHAFHLVHRRLVHAVQKLARIGREGLDVAALTLGKQSVEHQAGLARAAGAGHYRQFPGPDVQIEVLQVMLACAADADDPLGHSVTFFL